jgi:hypothetical protein
VIVVEACVVTCSRNACSSLRNVIKSVFGGVSLHYTLGTHCTGEQQ